MFHSLEVHNKKKRQEFRELEVSQMNLMEAKEDKVLVSFAHKVLFKKYSYL